MINSRITVSLTGSTQFDKQANFALASSLTLVAKEIQLGVIKQIESSFAVRSGWDKPSNIFGVRVKPATKQDLSAWIGTAADWLEKFIQQPAGAIVVKLPQGEFLAIPTKNVRRTKRDIISRAQRPRALMGKRDFILVTRRGLHILMQRRGRGQASYLVPLYFLVKRARIREKDFLAGPSEQIFGKRFLDIFTDQLQKAYRTAK